VVPNKIQVKAQQIPGPRNPGKNGKTKTVRDQRYGKGQSSLRTELANILKVGGAVQNMFLEGASQFGIAFPMDPRKSG
jgi:hypothetical protein